MMEQSLKPLILNQNLALPVLLTPVAIASASEGRGVTGGWNDLFEISDHLQYARLASQRALNLLEAKRVSGENSTVILDPGMVGLISHEAIGHMVEADF